MYLDLTPPSRYRSCQHDTLRIKGDGRPVATTAEMHGRLTVRRAQVPDAYRVIERGRRKHVLLWRHLQRNDRAGVAFERAKIPIVVQRQVANLRADDTREQQWARASRVATHAPHARRRGWRAAPSVDRA